MDPTTLAIMGGVSIVFIVIGSVGLKITRKSEVLTDLPQNLNGGPYMVCGFTIKDGKYIPTQRISPHVFKYVK